MCIYLESSSLSWNVCINGIIQTVVQAEMLLHFVSHGPATEQWANITTSSNYPTAKQIYCWPRHRPLFANIFGLCQPSGLPVVDSSTSKKRTRTQHAKPTPSFRQVTYFSQGYCHRCMHFNPPLINIFGKPIRESRLVLDVSQIKLTFYSPSGKHSCRAGVLRNVDQFVTPTQGSHIMSCSCNILSSATDDATYSYDF